MKNFILIILITLSTHICYGQSFEWALTDTPTKEPFSNGRACFSMDGKYGAIDTNGEVVIEPIYESRFTFKNGYAKVTLDNGNCILINRYGKNMVEPIYTDIEEIENSNGAYKMTYFNPSDSTYVYSIFYNNHIVADNIDSSSEIIFPFVKSNPSINIITEESIPSTFQCRSDYFYFPFIDSLSSDITDCRLFNSEGIEVNPKRFAVGSSGIKAYKSCTTHESGIKTISYGFLDTNNGDTITQANYDLAVPLFINDMTIAIDKTNNWKSVLIWGDQSISAYYDLIEQVDNNPGYFSLYNYTKADFSEYKSNICNSVGDNIFTEDISEDIVSLGKGWFVVYGAGRDGADLLINGSSNSCDEYKIQGGIVEGMIKISDIDGKYGYLNTETAKIITPKYKYCADSYSDGLAYVMTDDNQTYIIDKGENIVLKETNNIHFDNFTTSHEGVIGIEDRSSYTYGYIHNPLIATSYNYNQTYSASNDAINRWEREASILFEQEKYEMAKDMYYKVMMSEPHNIDALNGYATCLDKMGYYEDALDFYNIALNIDPENKLILSNIKATKINIDNEEDEDESESNDTKRKGSKFLNTLNNIAMVINESAAAYNESINNNNNYYYNNYSHNNNNNNKNNNSNTTATTSDSKILSEEEYQEQYDIWTKIAKINYDSLEEVRLSKEKRRTQPEDDIIYHNNLDNEKYLSLKKELEEAQDKMYSIRTKAINNNMYVPLSKYEYLKVYIF